MKRFMRANLLVYCMGAHETQRKPEDVTTEASVLDYIRMSRYPVAYCMRSENLKFPILGF